VAPARVQDSGSGAVTFATTRIFLTVSPSGLPPHSTGMFGASQDFVGGAVTSSLESYWLGAGLTWHFGRGACESGAWTTP
jgi:hypothetical protein